MHAAAAGVPGYQGTKHETMWKVLKTVQRRYTRNWPTSYACESSETTIDAARSIYVVQTAKETEVLFEPKSGLSKAPRQIGTYLLGD